MNITSIKNLRTAICCFAVGTLAIPLALNGQDYHQNKGAVLLAKSTRPVSEAKEAVGQGHARHAMACANCKDVAVERVVKTKPHIQKTVSGVKHLCEACRTDISYTGHGKQKTRVLTHLCGNCSSEHDHGAVKGS